MTKVAAVVLSWNGREDTLACLRSLESEDVDVVVVDNASEDGSAQAARGVGADVIENERNLGYAGGMNTGIRRALERGADAVLLLNNDVEVDPGAVATLAAAAPGSAAVCPVVVFADDPGRVWYAGARFDPRRGYNGRHMTETGGNPTETERICGAAVLMPREAIERVGMFDEQLFAYVEDADWSLRARAAGLRLLVVPAGTVRHKVSASTGGEGSPDAIYYSARNLLTVCERHAPLGRVGTWRRRLTALAAFAAQTLVGRRRRAGLRALRDGWRDFRAGRLGPRDG
jgi:GT2 family glycosyltransferase